MGLEQGLTFSCDTPPFIPPRYGEGRVGSEVLSARQFPAGMISPGYNLTCVLFLKQYLPAPAKAKLPQAGNGP